MILILAVFVLSVVFSIGFMVGAKQQIKQIKKDGGYFDMEITGAVYPYRTSSVNNDTMEFNPPNFKDIPKWTPPISSVDTMGTIGSKPKTQTDYQREHAKIEPCIGHELESQREIEKGDINFMYNWIREKSGK
jgi:hypothetical protein